MSISFKLRPVEDSTSCLLLIKSTHGGGRTYKGFFYTMEFEGADRPITNIDTLVKDYPIISLEIPCVPLLIEKEGKLDFHNVEVLIANCEGINRIIDFCKEHSIWYELDFLDDHYILDIHTQQLSPYIKRVTAIVTREQLLEPKNL